MGHDEQAVSRVGQHRSGHVGTGTGRGAGGVAVRATSSGDLAHGVLDGRFYSDATEAAERSLFWRKRDAVIDELLTVWPWQIADHTTIGVRNIIRATEREIASERQRRGVTDDHVRRLTELLRSERDLLAEMDGGR